VLFFKERLGPPRLIALALALVGCVLTVDPLAMLTSSQTFSWLGALFAFGSAFSNSIYIVLSSKFGKGLPGLVMAAVSVPITALAFLGWCVYSGEFQFQMSPVAWLCCLGIGVLTAFALASYLTGIQLIGPSQAAITSTTEP